MLSNGDSGLNTTRFRSYDPAIGRWLTRDPLGEASDPMGTLYRYADGNPLSYVDPRGDFLWAVVPAAVGAVIGGGAEAWLQYQQYGQICSWGSVFAQAGIGAVSGAFAAFGGGLLEEASLGVRVGYQAYNGAKFGFISGAVGALMDGQSGPTAYRRMAGGALGGGLGGGLGEAAGNAAGSAAARATAVGTGMQRAVQHIVGSTVSGATDQATERMLPSPAGQ